MLAILNSLNVHNLPIFQPILMVLVSKFMVHRALSDKTYLSLGLLFPLRSMLKGFTNDISNQFKKKNMINMSQNLSSVKDSHSVTVSVNL